MEAGFMNRWPLWLVFVVLMVIMILALELGRKTGIRDRTTCDDDSRTHATGLNASVLGLLALILGFTFSMAVYRYELNRDMIVAEASAIETAYERADLTVEPQRSALKDGLRRYLGTRIDFYDAGSSREMRARVDAESERLHFALWNEAAAAAARAPTSTTALLVESINMVTEFHAKRVDARSNHVPPTILWALLVMAAAAAGLTGYVSGFGNIAVVTTAIMDLDRPMSGLIRTGQPAMLHLREILSRQPPTATR
jgi:hypothetical protein